MKNLLRDFLLLFLFASFLSLYFDFRLILGGIVIFIIILKLQKEEKPVPVFSDEIKGWLEQMKVAVKNKDNNEAVRCYHILMNMAHAESLLEPKEHTLLFKTIQMILIPLKMNTHDFVFAKNTFQEPNYDVSF